MKYFSGAVIACLIVFACERIYRSTRKQVEGNRRLKKYTIRVGSIAAVVGWGGVALLGIAALLYALGVGQRLETVSDWVPCLVVFGAFLLLAVFLILLTVPRFWDIDIDHDDITVNRLFFIHRHFNFNDIHHAAVATDSLKVYMGESARPAFAIEMWSDNSGNFVHRLKEAQVPIIPAKMKPSQEFNAWERWGPRGD